MLDATFHHIEGHQYEGMDLKPYLRNDVQYLDPDQVKQERSDKTAIFASVKTVRILYPPHPSRENKNVRNVELVKNTAATILPVNS